MFLLIFTFPFSAANLECALRLLHHDGTSPSAFYATYLVNFLKCATVQIKNGKE